MITAIEPERTDDLVGQADEAERRLLLTLDVLAERRRHFREVVFRARETLESGALLFTMLLVVGVGMIGVLALVRRPRLPRIFRRR